MFSGNGNPSDLAFGDGTYSELDLPIMGFGTFEGSGYNGYSIGIGSGFEFGYSQGITIGSGGPQAPLGFGGSFDPLSLFLD